MPSEKDCWSIFDRLLRFYSCANSSIKFYCQGRAPKGRGKTGGKWGQVKMLEACPKDVLLLLEERRRRKEEEKRRKREEKAIGDSAKCLKI